MMELWQDKVHDERRQGEAFAPLPGEETAFGKKFYIESYGCQMNFSDSEIVASILQAEGFGATRQAEEADLVLLNTCSIREKAEQTVRKRLVEFRSIKKQKPGLLVGVLGCMAERLKNKLLEEEQLVDLVVGPDAYRTLPGLIQEAGEGQKAVNVLLSRDETYADIAPVRLDSNGVTAFVSIMRGCNNMCSFCVVPFTRGRERSRNAASIEAECRDSYHWVDDASGQGVNFAELLDRIARIAPVLRIRFSTSHPKDITDQVLQVMASHPNICRYIHLPLQSGSTRVLQLMNRTYTREWYLAKVKRIREYMPDCGISADIIAGFCTETAEDHADTLDVMQQSAYDFSYMFMYSERPGTLAARRFADDVPEDIKKKRLNEIIALQNRLSLESNERDIGKTFTVLVEGNSRRSEDYWMGRNSQNKVIVFPKSAHPGLKPGSFADVTVQRCTQGTLLGN
jgi:tRNA-2-methylthio-N6-dimethylallyladenosine synthase